MKKMKARMCFAALAHKAERLEREVAAIKAQSARLACKIEEKEGQLEALLEKTSALKNELKRRAARFKHPVVTRAFMDWQREPRRM